MQTDVPQGNPMYPNMNPLATQFMTGGQMEYMPNAQFLTSSQYGAFRTTPSFAQHSNIVQNPTLWQSYTQAHMGALPGISGSEFMLNNYIPQANQLKLQAMAQRRLTDAGSAFGSTGTDMLSSLGGAAIGFAMGGPMGALSGATMLPSISAPYMDRIRNSRALQQLSMSKIAAGSEVSKGLGQGFSLQASSALEENVIKSSISDKLFKEEDFRKIQKLGMESGLYDFESSSDGYKRTLKKLTKNFKFMMGMLETADMGEIAKDMQRLQRMGMSADLATSVSSAENTYGRMAGLNHQQMVDTYGKQGALTFSQYGLTGYQGSLESMAAAARVETMKRLGIVSESEVSRRGGVSGMTQNDTKNTAIGMDALSDYILPALLKTGKDGKLDFKHLDKSLVSQAITGDSKLFSNVHTVADRMQKAGSEGYMAYQGEKAELTKQLFDQAGPEGIQLLMAKSAQQMGREAGQKTTKAQMTYGYMQLFHMNAEDARHKAEQMANPEYLKTIQDQLRQGQHTRKTQAATLRKQEHAVFKRAGAVYNKFMYEQFGSIYGAYSANAARDKDREENELLGVIDTSQSGIGFGTKGVTQEEQDKLTSGVKDWEFLGKDKYDDMAGSWEHLTSAHSEIASQYRNADQMLHSKNMSTETRIAGLKSASDLAKDAGLSLDAKDLRFVSNNLEDISDLSTSNMQDELVRLIRSKNPGTTDAKARKLANKILKTPGAKNSILSMMANADKERYTFIADEMSRKHQEAIGVVAKRLDTESDSIRDDLGELVEQHGIFRIDDAADVATLSTATKTSVKALDAFEAFKVIGSLTLGDESDAVMDKDRTRRRELLERSIQGMGMSEEQIAAVLKSADEDGSMVEAKKLISEFMQEKLGLKEEQTESLQSAGLRAGTHMSSTELDVASTNSQNLKKRIAVNAKHGRDVNVYSAFADDFDSHGMDAKSALLDSDKIGQLIEQLQEEDATGNSDKIKKYTSLQKGLQDETISTISQAADVFNLDTSQYVQRKVSDSMEDDTAGAKQQTAVINAFGDLINKLDGPLRLVSVAMQEVAKSTTAMRVATQQKQTRNVQ